MAHSLPPHSHGSEDEFLESGETKLTDLCNRIWRIVSDYASEEDKIDQRSQVGDHSVEDRSSNSTLFGPEWNSILSRAPAGRSAKSPDTARTPDETFDLMGHQSLLNSLSRSNKRFRRNSPVVSRKSLSSSTPLRNQRRFDRHDETISVSPHGVGDKEVQYDAPLAPLETSNYTGWTDGPDYGASLVNFPGYELNTRSDPINDELRDEQNTEEYSQMPTLPNMGINEMKKGTMSPDVVSDEEVVEDSDLSQEMEVDSRPYVPADHNADSDHIRRGIESESLSLHSDEEHDHEGSYESSDEMVRSDGHKDTLQEDSYYSDNSLEVSDSETDNPKSAVSTVGIKNTEEAHIDISSNEYAAMDTAEIERLVSEYSSDTHFVPRHGESHRSSLINDPGVDDAEAEPKPIINPLPNDSLSTPHQVSDGAISSPEPSTPPPIDLPDLSLQAVGFDFGPSTQVSCDVSDVYGFDRPSMPEGVSIETISALKPDSEDLDSIMPHDEDATTEAHRNDISRLSADIDASPPNSSSNGASREAEPASITQVEGDENPYYGMWNLFNVGFNVAPAKDAHPITENPDSGSKAAEKPDITSELDSLAVQAQRLVSMAPMFGGRPKISPLSVAKSHTPASEEPTSYSQRAMNLLDAAPLFGGQKILAPSVSGRRPLDIKSTQAEGTDSSEAMGFSSGELENVEEKPSQCPRKREKVESDQIIYNTELVEVRQAPEPKAKRLRTARAGFPDVTEVLKIKMESTPTTKVTSENGSAPSIEQHVQPHEASIPVFPVPEKAIKEVSTEKASVHKSLSKRELRPRRNGVASSIEPQEQSTKNNEIPKTPGVVPSKKRQPTPKRVRASKQKAMKSQSQEPKSPAQSSTSKPKRRNVRRAKSKK